MSDCTECGWPVATDADNDRPCDDHCDHCRGLCWHEFTGVHRDDVRPDAAIATLTHRAEVAERSCEDAKRREQEASAKMQAMAQSESNKALRARAEAAERELAEVHRGVESVALHDARVARDAANDAAALWRERCNKAEQKADVLTAELRRLYAAVCRGQTRSDDARAIAQAVIDEYVQTAEQCDRNDALLERMGESRSLCIEALRGVQATDDVDAQTWDVVADGIRALWLRVDAAEREIHRIACGEQVEGDGLCEYGIRLAQVEAYTADILDAESLPVPVDLMERLSALEGHHLATSLAHLNARAWARAWKRLARHYQSCHLAGHACLRETHRAKGEQIAALRRARDDDAAYRSDLMEQCDALRAKLARAEGVVAAARAVAREHDRYLSDEVGTMGHVDEACDALRAALATVRVDVVRGRADRREGRQGDRDPAARGRGGVMTDLQDRVDDLVAWARSRIEHCRREEAKFGAGSVAIDASQERRTLQAVLRTLEVEEQ